jgi:hypothetical protein
MKYSCLFHVFILKPLRLPALTRSQVWLNITIIWEVVFFFSFFFFFVVLGFELKAYTLSHSASPFL